MTKHIVDLSKYNDNIDWDIATPQLDLAICRVQYGSRKIDPLYNEHVRNLEAYGIPHAAYAYGCYVSIADAIVEAEDFLARVNPNATFLVLDVEDDTLASCGATNLAEASQAFIHTCRDAGWKTGLYVSHHMYGSYGLQNVQADFLWIPRYGGRKPKYACDLWQYADGETGGWLDGIGKVDLNDLNGDKTLEWFTNAQELYRIFIGDFNSIEWTEGVYHTIKGIFPDYGMWTQPLDDGNQRIIIGDFNSKTWCDETFAKLKEIFPSYGMWIERI
ncbi:GH25 family lysozyme [Bacillus sp. NPDC077411]|uniref:GH25 family lysozyme n=1 Tax=Bacillus sp. NPDC077411 TaxID=3363947 RepID=UPI0037C8F78A